MARTYVVTGDPRYKKYHQDILDIREGRMLRPDGYFSSYWDSVLADARSPLVGRGRAVSLLDLMRRSDIPDEELSRLVEAEGKLDGLASLEFKAMKLAETVGPGAEAARARARLMLHDENYHRIKGEISKPINKFYFLMDNRTLSAVRAAVKAAFIFRIIFITASFFAIFMLLRTYAALRATLGGSADEVYAHMLDIGRGEFSVPIRVAPGRGNSVLAGLSEMRAKLQSSEIKRKRDEDELRRLAQMQRRDEFRMALEAAANAMVMIDSQGRIVLTNAEADRLFGYPKGALNGQIVEVLVPDRFKTAHPAQAPSRLLWKIEKRNLWLKKKDNHAS